MERDKRAVGKRSKHGYKEALRALQIELVKAQCYLIGHRRRVLVIFEGRDAAGKDGTIKRIIEHMSPRETRVIALGKPSDREQGSWYFQRFVPHLPAAEEMAFFNRSWYNRAGVEKVMEFCTRDEYEAFFASVVPFEEMLRHDGVQIIKYYLDITRREQRKRLKDRASDPLTQWKVSPIDQAATRLWHKYSVARDVMLAHTHSRLTPWTIVQADDKKQTRLNVIRDLLKRLDCPACDRRLMRPDPHIVFEFKRERLRRLAR